MSVADAPLLDAVRTNCRISDARHARELTLCTYLLAMRDAYRWEHGLDAEAPLPPASLGAWVAEREAQWDALEGADYVALPVGDVTVGPFDAAAVNRALVPRGQVYAAGIGRFGKPQFFLGELLRDERRDGLRVLVAGREWARDLAPAPAALRADTVVVRQDALRRWLRGKIEVWAHRRAEGPLARALAAYGIHDAPRPALERMVATETEALILHEIGEHRAGAELGPDWPAMLAELADRRAELFARAVRDHLADCLVTLPALLAQGDEASLHFWFGNLEGVRRELAPRLVAAGGAFAEGDRGQALRLAVNFGGAHWHRVAAAVLALHREHGAESAAAIARYGESPAARW